MRTIFWYLNFVIGLLLTVPGLIRHDFIHKKDPAKALAYANKIARRWARLQFRASGSSCSITGLENIPENRAVLFVSNHQSNFDIAVFLSLIPGDKGYIAKSELKMVPILRQWMEKIQCLFIDRKDMKKSVQVILDGIKLLKAGYSMVVFPEGTRSKGGPLGEFKAGSFKLAVKSGVPIVPVTINGSYKIMEANGNRIKPGHINITIHEPIEVVGLNKDELSGLPERVKALIQSAL